MQCINKNVHLFSDKNLTNFPIDQNFLYKRKNYCTYFITLGESKKIKTIMSVTSKCLIFLALANIVFTNARKYILYNECKIIKIKNYYYKSYNLISEKGGSGGQSCSVDLTKDASKSQVLYLQTDSIDWRYPKDNTLSPGSDGHLVRIGCPGGFVQLRDNITVWK